MKFLPVFLFLAFVALVHGLTIDPKQLADGVTEEMVIQTIANPDNAKSQAILFRSNWEVTIVHEYKFGWFASMAQRIILNVLTLFISFKSAVDSIIAALRTTLNIQFTFQISMSFQQQWERIGGRRCIYEIKQKCFTQYCNSQPQYLALFY